MMKSLLCFVILFIHYKGSSQNFIEDHFPTKDGRIYYSQVTQVDSSISASDLYLNYKDWLIDAFKSSKSVIELDDKESKVIVVRSYLQKEQIVNVLLNYTYNRKIWFTMKVETKDGRYRASIYDVRNEVDVDMQNSPIHIDQEIETTFRLMELPEKEKQRTKIIESTNVFCKELDLDFRNILAALEKAMNVKNNKDW